MLELFGQIAVYAVGAILLVAVAAMGILPTFRESAEEKWRRENPGQNPKPTTPRPEGGVPPQPRRPK